MLRRDFNKLLCLLPITGGGLFGSNTSTVEQKLIYHQQDYLHPFFRAFKATLLTKAQNINLVEGDKLSLHLFDNPILQGTGRFGFYGFTGSYKVGFSIDAKLEELQSIVESVREKWVLPKGTSLLCASSLRGVDNKLIRKVYFYLHYLIYKDIELSRIYSLDYMKYDK
jgi:hypothetical protein